MSSGILRRVALVRTYISEDRVISIIRETGISERGTTLTVTSYDANYGIAFPRSVPWLLVIANVVLR
jgi:hypothetical protein